MMLSTPEHMPAHISVFHMTHHFCRNVTLCQAREVQAAVLEERKRHQRREAIKRASRNTSKVKTKGGKGGKTGGLTTGPSFGGW